MKERNNFEQEMVDILIDTYKNISFLHFDVKENPDVSFKCNINGINYYMILESKVFNKSNSSNYPKQLLCEILMNRDEIKKKKIEELENFKTAYGILLTYDDKKFDKIYEFLKNHISIDDWITFGSTFDCKYVFLFDKVNKKLYYCEWDCFLNNPNPIEY